MHLGPLFLVNPLPYTPSANQSVSIPNFTPISFENSEIKYTFDKLNAECLFLSFLCDILTHNYGYYKGDSPRGGTIPKKDIFSVSCILVTYGEMTYSSRRCLL